MQNKLTITWDNIRKIAKPGDLLIGNFRVNDEMTTPVLMIGECVECTIGKEEVVNNTTQYLEKNGNIYIIYEVE